MKGNPLDLSFSGLKTAVLRHVRAADMEEEIERRRKLFMAGVRPTSEQALAASPQATLDLLAAFQQRVIEELLRRALEAAEGELVESIIVSGGVAANRGLRERFTAALASHLPELEPGQLLWRFLFMIGAMAHTMAISQDIKSYTRGLCDPDDVEGLIRAMVPFVAAGFRAPVPVIDTGTR